MLGVRPRETQFCVRENFGAKREEENSPAVEKGVKFPKWPRRGEREKAKDERQDKGRAGKKKVRAAEWSQKYSHRPLFLTRAKPHKNLEDREKREREEREERERRREREEKLIILAADP